MSTRTRSAHGKSVKKVDASKDPGEILGALEDAQTVIVVVTHALHGIEQDRGGVRPQFCGAEIRLLERGVKELTAAIAAANEFLASVVPAHARSK
jgi:hypothetical protein